jgi:hypothetical protein
MGENRQGKIGKENKHLQKPKVLQRERIAHPPMVCHTAPSYPKTMTSFLL